MAHSQTTTSSTTFSTTQDMAEHPNPIPNPHHRKIDLQSHGDLTYLQQNLALVAREKLDLYFPPPPPAATKPQAKSAPPATIISLDGTLQDSIPQQIEVEKTTNEGGEMDIDVDPLRGPVTALIDQFLRETYTAAAQSVTVNGIDASSLPPSHFPTASNPSPSTNPETSHPPDPSQEIESIHYTYSPFDRKLQKQMQALYEEVESLTAQVASLRRETPKAAAETYVSSLQSAMDKEEESWVAQQERSQAREHPGLEFTGIRQGWNEDVKSMYERGMVDLAVLSGVMGKDDGRSGVASLTETVGKAERARAVAGEFE